MSSASDRPHQTPRFAHPNLSQSTKWTLTNLRFDNQSGCCGTSEDTVDIRRVSDLHYAAPPCIGTNSFMCCCCKGVVTIHCADPSNPILKIDTWGIRGVFHDLKNAVAQSKLGLVGDAVVDGN